MFIAPSLLRRRRSSVADLPAPSSRATAGRRPARARARWAASRVEEPRVRRHHRVRRDAARVVEVRHVPVVGVLARLADQVRADAARAEEVRQVHLVLVLARRRDRAEAQVLVRDRPHELRVAVPARLGDVARLARARSAAREARRAGRRRSRAGTPPGSPRRAGRTPAARSARSPRPSRSARLRR